MSDGHEAMRTPPPHHIEEEDQIFIRGERMSVLRVYTRNGRTIARVVQGRGAAAWFAEYDAGELAAWISSCGKTELSPFVAEQAA